MSYRPYPNVDRALRQVGRSDPVLDVDDYQLSTRGGEHRFEYDGDHVQRCTRCRLPHAHWSGGPCPGVPQEWGPGRYV